VTEDRTATEPAVPDDEVAPTEWRVDDLAREAGTTVRNVRSYQDRGLLPPPRREGRVAWYGEGHLVRLRLISSLLERGFTLANIGELIEGWRHGRDLGDLMGVRGGVVGGLVAPFSDEEADEGTVAEVTERYGLPDGDESAAARALELGLVELHGDRMRVPVPSVLRAGIDLHQAGIPFDTLLAELARVRADMEAVAERFVSMVVEHVIEPTLVDGIPAPDRVSELTAAMARIRPLAAAVVEAELARALESKSEAELNARLTTLLADPD
jgi:DNA-binding transcriptional MerR regulator